MAEGFSDDELLDCARKCIQVDFPLYDLAHKSASAKGRTFAQVVFSDCKDESEARVLLKEAAVPITAAPAPSR